MKVAQVQDEALARRLAAEYAGEWRVVERQEREEWETPPPPYTTASLLADAALRLGWSAERTMAVAQNLFEGGCITYPRTDSTRVTPQAVKAIRRVIVEEYGASYLGNSFSLAEDGAHEAIRPTDPTRRPEAIADVEGRSLYRLIRQRTLAAFMRPARLRMTTLTLERE